MTRFLIWIVTSLPIVFPCDLYAQSSSVSDHVETLGLPSLSVGRVTVHYSAGDMARAEHLAQLAEGVAAFYEDELGISFDFGLAALSLDDWLQPYGADMPYGIPWYEERIVVVPSSLQEGVLIGPNEIENRHMVDITLLHEFGHLANKAYFHPNSVHDELSIPWFEELLASYFAFRYAYESDRAIAESSRERSHRVLASFTPKTLSLDWTFMRSLPGPEIADTYGWYQYMLNLRAIELHEEYGADLLPALKSQLPLESLGEWTHESLLERLDSIAPGFERWVDDLESGKLPR